MKGICMKDFLLKQFIAGNKTMTRRTGGLEKVNEDPDIYRFSGTISNNTFAFARMWHGHHVETKHCIPRYAKGTTVYIKEGYLPASNFSTNVGTAYASDWNNENPSECKPKYKNKLFMPASEARYFALIEDVYPQRLQDITEEDAIQEGVECDNIGSFKDYQRKWNCYTYARDSFATLIVSINGKGTWDKNPWVWVYKIKMVDNADKGYYPKSIITPSAADLEDSINRYRTEQLKYRF